MEAELTAKNVTSEPLSKYTMKQLLDLLTLEMKGKVSPSTVWPEKDLLKHSLHSWQCFNPNIEAVTVLCSSQNIPEF